jgi:hypothetical protein
MAGRSVLRGEDCATGLDDDSGDELGAEVGVEEEFCSVVGSR